MLPSRSWPGFVLFLAAAYGGTPAEDLRARLDEAAAATPAQRKAAIEAASKALDRVKAGDAAEAIAPAHWPFLAALAKRPEDVPLVRRLLKAAYDGAPDPVVRSGKAAPQSAETLAEAATLDPRYTARFDAALELGRAHGERAVPCLLPYLRRGGDTAVRAQIAMITRIGAHATLPLAAAAKTPEDTVRHFVVAALGARGDPRAVPVLLELREAAPQGAKVPSDAERALDRLTATNDGWAGDGTAASAYLALARRYFDGDPAVAKIPPGEPLVWTLQGRELVPLPVARHLYLIELGERAAQDAARLARNRDVALELLRRFRESEELAEALVRELGR